MKCQHFLLITFAAIATATAIKLKQCKLVTIGSKPVLCSNEPDYRKNELPISGEQYLLHFCHRLKIEILSKSF